MTVYEFDETAVWDNLGGTVRLARNVRVNVTDTDTGAVAANLQQSGQPVSWVTTDDHGAAVFTSTQGSVTITAPNGLSRIIYSPAYVRDVLNAANNATAQTDTAVSSAITTSGSQTQTALDNRYPQKGSFIFNVRDYGAKGDGTTLDTTAINNAITAGAGHTVYLPPGTYLIDATTGIKLNQAGTRLLLDQAATVKVQTNSATGYMAVEVTAADCVIEGGTFFGDVDTHTGTTGEWGHLLVANAGSDRLRIRGVKVTKAWGDGITLQGGSADISVIDVVADDNRRQGMSIISAARPRVTGGVYRNTGLTKSTAPTAGIDVEPNASTTVTDCVITGVTFAGNKGPGLQIATASGSLAEVTVTGCRSTGSTTMHGFYLVGPDDTIKAKLTGCHSRNNALHGFCVNANKTELSACTAHGNTQYGFQILASDCNLINPVASENGRHGITNSSTSVLRTRIIGGVTRANSQTTSGSYINVDIQGPATIIGHMADAGQLTNKPAWGFVVRTGVVARLIGCDVDGTYVTASLLDQPGNTFMVPRPGTADPSVSGATTTTTAPAAGAAGALPTAPAGYYQLNINGTVRKIPYY